MIAVFSGAIVVMLYLSNSSASINEYIFLLGEQVLAFKEIQSESEVEE
jgi:hypothetical protein